MVTYIASKQSSEPQQDPRVG